MEHWVMSEDLTMKEIEKLSSNLMTAMEAKRELDLQIEQLSNQINRLKVDFLERLVVEISKSFEWRSSEMGFIASIGDYCLHTDYDIMIEQCKKSLIKKGILK